MAKRPKHPPHADISQLAKSIVDAATDEAQPKPESPKASAGRLGGQIGGNARASNMSAARRAEIARNAARKRWHQAKNESPADSEVDG